MYIAPSFYSLLLDCVANMFLSMKVNTGEVLEVELLEI